MSAELLSLTVPPSHRAAGLMTGVCVLQAFWNWVENYPDEFTMLYQRPQTDMAGEYSTPRATSGHCVTSHQVTSGAAGSQSVCSGG